MRLFQSILKLSLSVFILISCSEKQNDLIVCGNEIPPVYMNFNVLDSESEQDLFFSDNPTYGIEEIYFFNSEDINQENPIRPTIEGTGLSRYFKLLVDNTQMEDILFMRVGENPQDKLTVKMKKTEEPCPVPVIDKILLNDSELVEVEGRIQIKK